jgi:REP element-mobilizing transposase RayT
VNIPVLPLFFDRDADVSVSHGRLPHWEQPGTVCYITFRTWDSLPRSVVAELLARRDEWLRAHDIDPTEPDWEVTLERLSHELRTEFQRVRAERWEGALDRCSGTCPLRAPALARVVADSLEHFDGERYTLFDYVVMPNHVHLLAAFESFGAMRDQCTSWKHFTGTRLNRALGRTGRFWESESFDHLVRSDKQFERLRDYIADNPAAARLRATEFVHSSTDLPTSIKRTAPLAERADHSPGEIQ